MSKKKYRVRNWKEYNKSLVRRGDLTFWVSPEMLSQWTYQGKRSRGGVQLYSELAIQTSLVIKELFHLGFRQSEGFMASLLKQLGEKTLKSPDYTTLCRRAKELKIQLSTPSPGERGLHILIDSTGISIYGEGEWQRKKLHKDKQRDWRKLHIAVDRDNLKILSVEVSGGRGYDANYLGPLVDAIKGKIESIHADGAYDKRNCYLKAAKIKARLIVPPQRNACEQAENRNYENDDAYDCRDEAIRWIELYEGDEETSRKAWKEWIGYHQRSLVETMMFRLKSIFGDVIRCRTIENQKIQLLLRCYVLNKMTELGMPQSVAIENE